MSREDQECRTLFRLSSSRGHSVDTPQRQGVNSFKTTHARLEVAMTKPTLNLHIDLTTRCNLVCMHCRVIQERYNHELTVAEITDIISRLASAYRFRGISLGGGEPLLRKDLTEILSGISTVVPGVPIAITSNGWFLTEVIVAKLAGLVGMIQVSLDGATATTHDSIRGVSGSYDHAVQGIKNCIAARIHTAMRFTVMRENYHEAIPAYELADQLGVVRFGIRRVIPAGRALQDYTELAISPEAYRQLLLQLIEASARSGRVAWVYGGDPLMNVIGFRIAIQRMYKDGYFATTTPNLQQLLQDPHSRFRWFGGCAPGVAYLYIAANGNLYPCPMLRYYLGNALDADIPSLLQTSAVLTSIRQRRLDGKCGVCKFRFMCGGCRAAAYENSGNILGEDPMCPFSEDEVREQTKSNTG